MDMVQLKFVQMVQHTQLMEIAHMGITQTLDKHGGHLRMAIHLMDIPMEVVGALIGPMAIMVVTEVELVIAGVIKI